MSDHTALREILEAELRIAEEVSRRRGVPLGPVQLSQRVVREAIAALAPPADPEALARKIALRLAAAWDAFPEGAKATWATGIIKDMLLADRAAAVPAPEEGCPYCSRHPTNMNDYCDTHRPQAAAPARPALSDETLRELADTFRHHYYTLAGATDSALLDFARAVLARQQERR